MILFLKDFLEKHTVLVIVLLVLIGAFLRFVSLDWGGGHFLHPDELNIGFAVSRIHLPNNANPQFFAYGALPIYVTYFIGVLQNIFDGTHDIWNVTLNQALTTGRYLSAFASTALIPMLYLLARELDINKLFSLFVAFCTTFLIGFIQFAHFATFEIFLTFFYTLIVFIAINAFKKQSLFWYIVLGVSIGLTVGTKIVSLYLIGLPFFVMFLNTLSETDEKQPAIRQILSCFHPKILFHPYILSSLFASVVIFFVVNPFIVLDNASFQDSLTYEQGVATGTLPVFYTRNFLETIPGLYQLQHVFPFISGYIFFISSLIATSTATIFAIRNMKSNQALVLFLYVFGGYTLFHIAVYVKWLRYMIPVLPFLIISLALVGQKLFDSTKNTAVRFVLYTLFGLIMLEIVFRGMSFSTIYLQKDTREIAAEWTSEHIRTHESVLSEVFDPNIIPFNEYTGHQITLFNMYELDEVDDKHIQFAKALESADYILLPSDRVYASALRLPEQFPIAANYYTALFANELGFERVYEETSYPCLLSRDIVHNMPEVFVNFLCPVNWQDAEGTFYVFDHPDIMLFKKVTPKTVDAYEEILIGSIKDVSATIY